MTKPKTKTVSYLDFSECRDYINKKYKCNIDDYAGMFTGKGVNEEVEFLSFWHWLIDRTGLNNGSIFPFDEEDHFDEKYGVEDEWVKEILTMFYDEFGVGEKGKRTIDFRMEW